MDANPSPVHGLTFPLVVDITWMLQNLKNEPPRETMGFSIDRASEFCFTPRRNPEIEFAHRHFFSLQNWARAVLAFFSTVFGLAGDSHPFDFFSLLDENIFTPVLPVLGDRSHKKLEQGSKERDRPQRRYEHHST